MHRRYPPGLAEMREHYSRLCYEEEAYEFVGLPTMTQPANGIL
jgi:hypothetical protein